MSLTLICLTHTEDPKNNFEFEKVKGTPERCLVNAVFLRLT